MRTVIVPNVVQDAIIAAMDAQIAMLPPDGQAEVKGCYTQIYAQLLAYYDETGQIPDFNLTKNTP